MIKISLVSYLNSKPFHFGIETFKNNLNINLSLDVPSECARKIIEKEADIGLIPVAILPLLKEKLFISNYCIGAMGKVSSVMLYSQVPLENIKTIALDFQSRTSVMLVRILAKHLWKIYPEFVNATSDSDLVAKDNKACVVIGDRTFKLNGKHDFEFDLSEEWFKLTEMPFVFACWVANKPIDPTFLEHLNSALKFGIDNRREKLSTWQKASGYADLEDYLMNKIRYDFGDKQKKALETFLDYLDTLSI